ncbi:MAG: hypothetical protein JEZ05_07950 [Tenericutes bacterium]|nr:hypothetical protein [Mycoplasmatota bacterium]
MIENNTLINCSDAFVFEESKSTTNYGPKNLTFTNTFIWTDSSSDAIFNYNTKSVNNTYENTITFNENVFYGGIQNSGNTVLSNTGINLSSFLSGSLATTSDLDNIIYYDGAIGAKELLMLVVKED